MHGRTNDNGDVIGYGTIGKELGITKDQARNELKRYAKKKKQ